jgi:hypothetical protein
VDERLMDVIARRDMAAAQRSDPHSDQPFPEPDDVAKEQCGSERE